MKTLCFLDRLELTDLFGPVSQVMPDDIRTLHLAYDDAEAAKLAAMGIEDVPVFKRLLPGFLKDSPPDAQRLAEIERLIVMATKGTFGLNSTIQSDRTMQGMAYDDCLRLADAYLAFWQDYVARYEVDHILHETVSLLFNFMAAIALAERGGSYLYAIMAQAEPGEYRFMVMEGIELYSPDITRALSLPRGKRGAEGYGRADLEAFLTAFRTNMETYLGGLIGQSVAWPRLAAKAVRNVARRVAGVGKLDPMVDAIELWGLRQNVPVEKMRNLRRYRREVRFDDFDPDQAYWFYPLHLEPEAVVLYQAHGIYTNQIKLIENIAGQLPPGHLLYVKDHPHDIGYRSADDYLRLNAVPNLRLLPAGVPGKQVIANAFGVITITGTAGFEAMLMRKPVVTFGTTFYTGYEGVERLDHIRDLRATLHGLTPESLPDDDALLDYLEAYLAAIHPGMISFFGGRAAKSGIDLDANARSVAQGLARSIRAL